MPLADFAEKRSHNLFAARHAKKVRCRSIRWLVFKVPTREVAPEKRYSNLNRWRARKIAAREQSSRCWPAHHALWLCIHSREGDWEDGGWPYWGGLQMGAWFLERYMGITSPQGNVGPNGWINAPSQRAQEFAAERAYRGSGYSLAFLHGQWPNTAPPCT